MASAMISVRTDEERKAEATDPFAMLGMDMTTAIHVFLRAASRMNGIPFAVVEGPDEAYKAHIEKTIAERRKRSKDPDTKYDAVDEMRKKAEIKEE